MKTLRNLVLSVAVLLVALALPGAAGAHVELNPTKAPAGKPVNLAFEIGHGCDGAATTSLTVQVPSGATDLSAKPVDGWKVKSTPKQLTWTGGPLADHDVQRYPFTATLYGKKGERMLFKAIQGCEGGAETAWISAGGGSTEADNPAPSVTLTSTAAEPAAESQAEADQIAEEDAAVTGDPTATAETGDESSDEGGDGKSLLLLIVAGLAIGTIAGLIMRARRRP